MRSDATSGADLLKRKNRKIFSYGLQSSFVFEPFLELNEWLKGYCLKNRIQLVDAYPALADHEGLLDGRYDSGDGVHLNGEGYMAFGRFVASEVSDLLQPGTVVACLGDSLTEGYPGHFVGEEEGAQWMPYPFYLEREGVTILNFGRSGDTTFELIRRFHSQVRVHEPAPDICIVHGGANDLFCDIPIDRVEGNLIDIYKCCRRHKMTPIAATLLPVMIR